MTTQTMTRARADRAAHRILAALAVVLLPLAACEGVLEVEDPENAAPETLDRPSAVPLLVRSTLFDFQGGYSGLGLDDKYAALSGVITDEFISSGTFTTRVRADQRNLFPTAQGNISDEMFEWLQRALRTAQMTEYALEKYAEEDVASRALVHSLMGYIYIAIAEAFCDPLPFARVVGNPLRTLDLQADLEFLEPISTEAALDTAVAQFDAALALNPDFRLAKVGKARALIAIDRDNLPEAAAAVADVPTAWVYRVEHSDNTFAQQNPIFNLNLSNERYSVSNLEGGAGTAFRGTDTIPGAALGDTIVLDPRLPWAFLGAGFDRVTPLFGDFLYPLEGTDVPLASGVEARLIEAEAAIYNNAAGTFVNILNDLRQQAGVVLPLLWEDYEFGAEEALSVWRAAFDPVTFPFRTRLGTLGPVSDPGTTQGRLELLLDERGFWLFATGHRQGDLRRMLRPDVWGNIFTDDDQIWPSGPYHKGTEPYGEDVAYPLPFEEQNNPNYTAEIAAMCNTTEP